MRTRSLATRMMSALAAVAFAATAWSGLEPQARAADDDTVVIAIPGLPQGVDLDRHIGPQTWTMGAQVYALGLEWEYGKYPYGTGQYFDPDKLPGFAYPIGYTNRHTVGGIMESCDTAADGLTVTMHVRHGVMSAYGNEFSADDVIWRIERERKNPVIYFLIRRSRSARRNARRRGGGASRGRLRGRRGFGRFLHRPRW